MKQIFAALSLLFCMTMLLLFPVEALSYTFTGLSLWLEKMVPTLFPFMMLSQILICFDLIPVFLSIFRPILRRLFRLPDAGLYCILTGFLCGFPMGAKNVSELYRRGQLSLSEAQTLLNFCNQIGPVFFLSFAYPILHKICPELSLPTALFGMYGIPLLCGSIEVHRMGQTQNIQQSQPIKREPDFDVIVTGNLIAISRLAGYMMFFPVLLILLEGIPKYLQNTRLFLCLKSLFYLLLEITGGLSFLAELTQTNRLDWISPAILVAISMGALQFGGCSCLFQTKSMIGGTALSLRSYFRARIKMTFLCVIFCVASSFCW